MSSDFRNVLKKTGLREESKTESLSTSEVKENGTNDIEKKSVRVLLCARGIG